MVEPLSIVFSYAALPVTLFFVWWRLDKIEKRLEKIEREIEALARNDKSLGERVARLEGRLNGAARC